MKGLQSVIYQNLLLEQLYSHLLPQEQEQQRHLLPQEQQQHLFLLPQEQQHLQQEQHGRANGVNILIQLRVMYVIENVDIKDPLLKLQHLYLHLHLHHRLHHRLHLHLYLHRLLLPQVKVGVGEIICLAEVH